MSTDMEGLIDYISSCIDSELWGPCLDWPNYAIFERSVQQWAAEEVINELMESDFEGSMQNSIIVIEGFMKKMARCLQIAQRADEENDKVVPYDADTAEIFKIAIQTAKNILHAIYDYYYEGEIT